jgi:hypothetical protein
MLYYGMGRKRLPEEQKKRRRVLYMTDAEWEAAQRRIYATGDERRDCKSNGGRDVVRGGKEEASEDVP